MRALRRQSYWLVVLVGLGFIGCGTTYQYKTGKKAALDGLIDAHVLATIVQNPAFSVDPGIREIIIKHDQQINRGGLKASLQELAEDDTMDPGVSYTLRTGMSIDEVREIVGEPVLKQNVESKAYDEILEYDFAFMYFKKNRLKDLKFKFTEQKSAENSAALNLIPPK